MYTKTSKITHPIGLHARPAAEFARTAAGYSSCITIGRPGGKAVNAKSVILLLSQGFGQGTEVEITAVGEDEREAVEVLVSLLASTGEE